MVRAALLTDGAARLVTTFALGGWEECLDLLQREGPAHMIAQVREAELADDTLSRWPRSKPHDDASAIYIRP